MSRTLRILRDLMQRDVCGRGLDAVPGDSLFSAFPDDLCYAARSLAWHPKPHLVVVTGFPVARPDGDITGETDGPLGACFLARALRPLGFRITIAAERFVPSELEINHHLPPLPDDVTHLLSIERVGPSRHDGRCYSMRARDVTEHVAPVHRWFEQDRPPGVVTMAIGDGGNEIGMGKIPLRVIQRDVALGGTIACRVSVDYLLVAGISNWGAYALAAAVHHLRGERPAHDLFQPQTEAASLERLVREGLIDGKTGRAEPTVDGLQADEYLAILPQLSDAITSAR